ncbi:hypothetical protein BU17DRAFT_93561 [Hysterangium stoloniferum]|nr:hypothetical protein BU17DRAFT_93561 [Hysterangium stoloniferum]
MSDSQPSHHTSYYFSNPVIFLVEDQLFRVPAHMFESTSLIFRDMFSLAPGPSQEVEGQADGTPVRLEQVSVVDFERLLRLFYPMGPGSNLNFDMEEWCSIFHLADKWDMNDVRLHAIKTLDQTGIRNHPALQINYGVKYKYNPWVYEGFCTLITREQSVTEKEGGLLGLRDTVRFPSFINSMTIEGYYGTPAQIQYMVLKQVFGDDIDIPPPPPSLEQGL